MNYSNKFNDKRKYYNIILANIISHVNKDLVRIYKHLSISSQEKHVLSHPRASIRLVIVR